MLPTAKACETKVIINQCYCTPAAHETVDPSPSITAQSLLQATDAAATSLHWVRTVSRHAREKTELPCAHLVRPVQPFQHHCGGKTVIIRRHLASSRQRAYRSERRNYLIHFWPHWCEGAAALNPAATSDRQALRCAGPPIIRQNELRRFRISVVPGSAYLQDRRRLRVAGSRVPSWLRRQCVASPAVVPMSPTNPSPHRFCTTLALNFVPALCLLGTAFAALIHSLCPPSPSFVHV